MATNKEDAHFLRGCHLSDTKLAEAQIEISCLMICRFLEVVRNVFDYP